MKVLQAFVVIAVLAFGKSNSLIIDTVMNGVGSFWTVIYDQIERVATKKPDKLPNEVCYDNVGCFVREDNNYNVGVFPEDPSKIATEFQLFTQQNQETPELLSYTDAHSISRSRFNPANPVKFIIHGFFENGSPKWIRNMRNSFFNLGNMNVIVVNWGKGACCDYVQSSANTETVGREIALLIDQLVKNAGATLANVHIVGFSLGGQAAGVAGKYVQTISTGKKVARITGLDPAGPLFCDRGHIIGNKRLLPEDAEFVDVIHTNAGSLSKGYMGCLERSGHVDFYPNGGNIQSACLNPLFMTTAVIKDTQYFACNHVISTQYFIETLTNATLKCNYNIYGCSDTDSFDKYRTSCSRCWLRCNQMGYHAQPIAARDNNKYLYVDTGISMPLCSA